MKVSPITDTKQETFEACLRWHLSVVKAIGSRGIIGSYNYLDCFCGEGHYISPNDNKEHEGSPVIFSKAVMADYFPFPINPYFNDKKQEHITQLETRLRFDVDFQEFELFNMDFQDFLNSVHLGRDKKAIYGLVYLDPYKQLTLDELATVRSFLSRYSRIDVMLNFPATSLKRCIGAREKSGYNYSDEYLSIDATLDYLGKKHWWIRLPIQGDKSQWCFLLGSNYEFNGAYRKFNITSLKTEKGREALEHFALTNEQKQNKLQRSFL